MNIPMIIPEEQFQRVQLALRESSPLITAPRIVHSTVLPTGIAICESCGATMILSAGTGQSGGVYRYYKCSKRLRSGTCKGPNCSIREDELNSIALNAIAQSLLIPARVREIVERIAQRRKIDSAASTHTLQQLRKQLVNLTAAQRRLMDAISRGLVTEDDLFRERFRETQEQRQNVLRLIEAQERLSNCNLDGLSESDARSISPHLRQKLESAPPELQKRLLRAILSTIVVGPDSITINGPDEALADAANSAKEGSWLPASRVQTSDRDWYIGHRNLNPAPSVARNESTIHAFRGRSAGQAPYPVLR